jgi:formate dehydrogenase subunit gamma
MAETTRLSPEGGTAVDGAVRGARGALQLLRFDRGERVLHWLNATLFAVMMATASALYVPQISSVVGRREVVKTVHVWTGLALPFPVVLTFVLRRWGRGFRGDVRRLNRWTSDDRRWLRTRGRDPFVVKGKFNAGQKLNAAFTAGAIVVMLGTGAIMRWPNSFPLSWRTGATFVHDWVFVALAVAITGHVLYATRDGEALRSMVGGWISGAWARRRAPLWYEEVVGEPAAPEAGAASAPGPGSGPADRAS